MTFPKATSSPRSRIAIRCAIWIAVGATVFSQMDAHALKNDLTAEATLLITEMQLEEDCPANKEFTATVHAARSNLFWGKGVGNVSVYSRVPRGEGDYEYYKLSNFYEQNPAGWENLGTFGYEDIDARDEGQVAFASETTN